MATSKEFVDQLKKDIQAFPKIRIKHPFLKAVCNGTATMDQIRAWAIQDYQFRAAVPRICMLRYLACTDPEIAKEYERTIHVTLAVLMVAACTKVEDEICWSLNDARGLKGHPFRVQPLRASSIQPVYFTRREKRMQRSIKFIVACRI